MLRVLLAGGGTAGHVNPALAIAEIIKKHYPDAEISFAGNPEKLEARLVPAAGYKFYPIKIEGFQRKPNWVNLKRNIHAAGCLVKSGSTAKKIIKEARPDLVIGTGGYVSGPIVRKAAKMGIKTAIHEQNAFPGVTNKILAKSADVVMLTVKEAEKYMPENAKTVVTGLPVRGAFNTMSKSEAKKQLGFDENEICVLSTGGSLGARVLNENIAKLLKQGKVNFFEAVYLLQPDKGTEAEQRIMKLVTQTPLSVPELVRCFENDVRDVSSADKVISAIYTEESDNQARLNNACSLSNHRQDVLEATTNLYLTRQVILEHA